MPSKFTLSFSVFATFFATFSDLVCGLRILYGLRTDVIQRTDIFRWLLNLRAETVTLSRIICMSQSRQPNRRNETSRFGVLRNFNRTGEEQSGSYKDKRALEWCIRSTESIDYK